MGRIYLSPPHMSSHERALLLDAFDSNWIAPLGPHVDALEEEFAAMVGRRHAVALSSGTAALHLALLLLGRRIRRRGAHLDLTFAATANAITYVGATPVFIDSDPRHVEYGPATCWPRSSAPAARRNKLPKAVVVVDLYGQCADYEPIRRACARYEVPIIEDAAEALGASYDGQAAGTFGASASSPSTATRSSPLAAAACWFATAKELAERARFLATQARDPAPHYQHSVDRLQLPPEQSAGGGRPGAVAGARGPRAQRRANSSSTATRSATCPASASCPNIPAAARPAG